MGYDHWTRGDVDKLQWEMLEVQRRLTVLETKVAAEKTDEPKPTTVTGMNMFLVALISAQVVFLSYVTFFH